MLFQQKKRNHLTNGWKRDGKQQASPAGLTKVAWWNGWVVRRLSFGSSFAL